MNILPSWLLCWNKRPAHSPLMVYSASGQSSEPLGSSSPRQWKLSRQVSVILLILGVICSCFWIHWRVSGGVYVSGRLQLRSRYASLFRFKILAAVQPRYDLTSSEGPSSKLWDSVGCNSKHPILRCKTVESNVTHFDVTASLGDFEDSVYLNSTVTIAALWWDHLEI